MAITYRNDAVSVGTSSVTLAAARENRRRAVFTNESTNNVWIFINETPAVANKGIRLSSGASLTLNFDDEEHTAIYAIADGAASTVSLHETYLTEV